MDSLSLSVSDESTMLDIIEMILTQVCLDAESACVATSSFLPLSLHIERGLFYYGLNIVSLILQPTLFIAYLSV